MKHQTLFSLKDESKKIKVLSAAVLLGSVRVKIYSSKMILKIYTRSSCMSFPKKSQNSNFCIGSRFSWLSWRQEKINSFFY